MAGRERLAGVGIVAQMEVDRVASTVSAGDGIDGSIRLASHCPGRLDPHRRALRHRRRRIAPTDVDIVHPAIDPIDHHVMAVAMLDGTAPADHQPDDPVAQLGPNPLLHPRVVEPPRGPLTLPTPEYVATLTAARRGCVDTLAA